MKAHHHGGLLVALQFVALTVLVMNAGPALRFWPSAIGLAASAGLMLWAVVSMGKTTFRFHPQPSEQGELATGGLYRWLRHPMYTAALLGSLVSAWMQPTLLAVSCLAVVALVLGLKMRFEEAALREKFPDYPEYSQRVPALVPFLPRQSGLRRILQWLILFGLVAVTVWRLIERLDTP
jgi:protein-S-isoprenylcysteine O-methyltransferase Ste14